MKEIKTNIVIDMIIQTTPAIFEANEAYFEKMSLDLNMNIDIVDINTGERIMLEGGRL